MKCPRCQQGNPPQAKFCEECAAPLARACVNCGAQLSATAKFCSECAHPAGPAAPPTPQRFGAPESYTPKHLAEKILTSKSALEGERKQVTVLFADLKGSMELLADRDPEEARKILDPVLERMMEAVHHYEGTVNQVMGDGIMALFGAPLAHEDHAVRACYAAIRMQQSVRAYGDEVRRQEGVLPQIRVGVNSGEVVVRSIGSDLHMDYTAVGQTTHLAARMEQMAAAGSTLMTADTIRFVEGYVEVRPLGPITVKGLGHAVEAYELLRAASSKTRLQVLAARGLTPFVGRHAEIEMLARALGSAGRGQGQIVALVGEPGVGKSRLFYEFAHSHRTRDWLVVQSGSVSYGKATPCLPLIDLLRAYLQVDDLDDARKIREKLSGKLLTLDETLMPALPALLALLGVPLDDPQWQALEPHQRRQRTLEACRRLLLRESLVQPLVLVFEDLHWVDGETQAFLETLVESLPTARILLLVNYRPEYQHSWGNKSYYTQLRIDPLPHENAEALLDGLLGDDRALLPLKRLLIERTEGNPFFLEECIRTLVETRLLAGGLGAYRYTGSVMAVQVPATVRAVLAARIDRLSPERKRLLQCAAVIGHTAPLTVLRAVSDDDDEELRRGLAQLQAAEFVYETNLYPDVEYTFKHALTLEVAYGSLLTERRRALHVRVLNALAAVPGATAGDNAEILAHHAVRAELWERAATYLFLAGRRAVTYARYEEAEHSYQQAIAALDRQGALGDQVLKLETYLELWVAWIESGRVDGLEALAERAESLANALGDGARLAQVRLRQAQAFWNVWDRAEALEAAIANAQQALGLADGGDVRTLSYARFIGAAARVDRGRFREAVAEFEAGLELFGGAEAKVDTALTLPIYISLRAWESHALVALGDFAGAHRALDDGAQIVDRIAHRPGRIFVQAFRAYAHIVRGEFELAQRAATRGLALAEEHDFLHGVVANAMALGYADLVLGARDRGLSLLARALAGRNPASAYVKTWTKYGTLSAAAYLRAGDFSEAAAQIEGALPAVWRHGARGYLPTLLRLRSELRSRQPEGDPVGALQDAGEALALATELGMAPEIARCHQRLAHTYRAVDEPQKAEAHLAAARGELAGLGMDFWNTDTKREWD